MQFVSIAGTQVLAVLNPLLALRKAGILIAGVTLLATEHEKSKENAEKLRVYLETGNLYFHEQIDIAPICSRPDTNSKLPQAHETLALIVASGRRVCFNAAGGMNYQVGLCMGELRKEEDCVVYPESKGVHLFEIWNKKKVSHRLLSLPDQLEIVDLFRLQGIDSKSDKKRTNNYLWMLLKKSGIDVPEPSQKDVVINDDAHFDLVFNRGNELNFLKTAWRDTRDTKTDEERLAGYRALINMATGRSRLNELFHRNIAVLCNDEYVAARLEKESNGKIKVINFAKDNESAIETLRKFISGEQHAPITEQSMIHHIPGRNAKGETVAVSLGLNLMPTLLALWSHKPGKAILFYTPGNRLIERFRNAFTQYDSLLPDGLATLEFHPVSIEGMEIFELSPPDVTFAVNINPGSKGHGVCLALWAGLHGGNIYSIRTDPAAICRLNPSGEERTLSGPSPATYLRLSGAKIESLGKKGPGLACSIQYKLLVQFFQAMIVADINIGRLIRRNETIAVNNFQCNLKRKADKLQLVLKANTKTYTYQWSKGEWFEEFVGHALCACGADAVQVRVRTPWPDELKRRLERMFPGQKKFMSDIDVVARFGGDYLAVSCKATKEKPGLKDREKIALEAEAHAQQFQRFCLPMVCILVHTGDPIRSTNGVPIFGYKTLADKDALRGLIETRLKEVRKTQ